MKRVIVLFLVCMVLLSNVVFAYDFGLLGKVLAKISGKFVYDSEDLGNKMIGPSQQEQECMKKCVSDGCGEGNYSCSILNKDNCMEKCGVNEQKGTTKEEKCVEECSSKGCGELDFECINKNKEKCDKECGMLGDRSDESGMSEEQKCISNCVAQSDPQLRCQPGEGGEKGNEICERCAKQCEHLYAGPCLDDKKLKAKQKECETCKHCYGESVMGDSSEGYDCIVDVKCMDASSEFGDEPGEGPSVAERVSGAVGDFFKGLFGWGEENTNDKTAESAGESKSE